MLKHQIALHNKSLVCHQKTLLKRGYVVELMSVGSYVKNRNIVHIYRIPINSAFKYNRDFVSIFRQGPELAVSLCVINGFLK